MEIIGLILAVIGVVLTVTLSDSFFRGIKKLMDKLKRSKWSGDQYRKGILQNESHIAFDDWSCRFEVDADGDCTQSYDVRITNISNKLVSGFKLPIFSDNKPLALKDLAAWATMKGSRLDIRALEWNENDAEGRIEVVFDRPLGPGERKRFQYGITLPKLFQEGDDYYDWDVEIPYYDMRGEIIFSPEWSIKYARWNIKGKAHPQDLVVTKSQIHWLVRFPTPGTRLHMDFGLQQKH